MYLYRVFSVFFVVTLFNRAKRVERKGRIWRRCRNRIGIVFINNFLYLQGVAIQLRLFNMEADQKTKTSEYLKGIVANLPEGPGIYQYLNAEGVIIYVGKTK